LGSVTGAAQVTRRLEQLAARMPQELAKALREELEIESTESQRRTPVDTGALRQSHRVDVNVSNGEVSGTITVGGPAAPYSIEVHENLEAFHPIGEAKFLENTLNESRPHLAKRIAERVDLERLAR
jgi:hypothetical protein